MEINATLLGQLITFAVLVWFTMKYVWPPITLAIAEREKKIAAGLAASEQGHRELEAAAHKVSTMMQTAKHDAAHIVDQAHKRAAQIVEEAKQQAKQEGQRLIEHAQAEIGRELNQVKEKLRKQLAVLAVSGAEKIIQRQLDDSAHANLLNELAAEI